MSLTKNSILDTLKRYWTFLEFIIDDKIDEAKRSVALGEIGTVVGSTNETDGRPGLVPAPTAGDETNKFLKADGLFHEISLSSLGAAAASHGNHVPATETPDNTKFLRNDNTWQAVTPANIGAAASMHTHDYLPLAGGTMEDTAQIKRATSEGTSWMAGRDLALVKTSVGNTFYIPITSLKTTNGSWEIGHYGTGTYNDGMLFTYILDSNYNANSNTTTCQFRFAPTGSIIIQERATITYNSTTGCLDINVS